MSNFLNKLKDFVGISEQEEYEEEYEEMQWEKKAHPAGTETKTTVESTAQSSRRTREPLNLTTETIPGSSTNMGPTARNNVIGMPGVSSTATEVVVIEPHAFGEMPQVIKTLRERKSVILNLNVMDPDEAQRAVDFVAGGTYAIEGHQERIGERIFLFTPSCVKVSNVSGSLNSELSEPARPANRMTTSVNTWAAESTRIAQ